MTDEREDEIMKQMRSPHDHGEDHTPAEIRESAYRRGYQHGFLAGLEAAEDPLCAIGKLTKDVAYWRFREGKFRARRDKVQRPPHPQFSDYRRKPE